MRGYAALLFIVVYMDHFGLTDELQHPRHFIAVHGVAAAAAAVLMLQPFRQLFIGWCDVLGFV